MPPSADSRSSAAGSCEVPLGSRVVRDLISDCFSSKARGFHGWRKTRSADCSVSPAPSQLDIPREYEKEGLPTRDSFQSELRTLTAAHLEGLPAVCTCQCFSAIYTS